MAAWLPANPSGPWYGGAAVAKFRAVVTADWPGTGNQGWTFQTFAPTTNYLQLGWYDADPGDVWSATFDGTTLMRTAIDAYSGGNSYTSGTDPQAGHIPALTAGQVVYLVAAQYGPTSPPDPTTTIEAWDPATDFGSFFDGDFGAGTNIGAPWATLDPVPVTETDLLLQWSFTVTRNIATSTWTGDDDDRWQIPFEWSFLIDLDPPDDVEGDP